MLYQNPRSPPENDSPDLPRTPRGESETRPNKKRPQIKLAHCTHLNPCRGTHTTFATSLRRKSFVLSSTLPATDAQEVNYNRNMCYSQGLQEEKAEDDEDVREEEGKVLFSSTTCTLGVSISSSAIYGCGYTCGCNLKLSEVRPGSFVVDLGPKEPQTDPKSITNRPDRTTSTCSHMNCSHIHPGCA